MYVSYDPEARVTYVKWAIGEVARTAEIGDLMMVDVDEDGHPLGVEFLMAPTSVTQPMLEALVDAFPALKALSDMSKWVLAPSPA